MRIVRLTAENIKKLKVVEIAPSGAVVQITGPNGSGKSSVLDSIFYALAGTSEIPAKVVRQGEQKAVIKLDLGEIVVTRRFTASGGTSLVVESQNGARFPSPQRLLDALVGSLTFDPLAFSRMAPREQLDALQQIVKLDVDLDALDAEASKAFSHRTELTRQAKALEARIAGFYPALGKPEDPVDVAALAEQMAAASKQNAETAAEIARRQAKAEHARGRISEALRLREDALRLVRKAIVLEQAADEENGELAELAPIPEPTDIDAIKENMRAAQTVNARVAERRKRDELAAELKRQLAAVDEQTSIIEQSQRSRTEAVSRAQMPVAGLSMGEGEVIYNGLPLAVASDAERLKVSVAIAMAANPKLRVLRVRDGSLLDENSLAQLAEMSALADYQVWIERVESPGRVGVVMEDGLATVLPDLSAEAVEEP